MKVKKINNSEYQEENNLKIIEINKDAYEFIYEKKELEKNNIDTSVFCMETSTIKFHNELNKFQNMVGNDIINSHIFGRDCTCFIDPAFTESEDKFAIVKISKANLDNLKEDVQVKREKGFVYMELEDMFDIDLVPDVFEKSSLLKSTDGKYILRCLADDVEKAKLMLCEFGNIVETPKNWNIVIKENAIKKIKMINS